ncbi:MAG: hypothetical protein R3A79_17575 [Nannocystaceae bacterium]
MHRANVIVCAAALAACFTNSDETTGAAASATTEAASSTTAEATTTAAETTAEATTAETTTDPRPDDPRCGDGNLDIGEECDDGNQSNADGCLNDCAIAFCGDGQIWLGLEECDDGPGNDAKSLSGCRPDCRAAACGDGAIYPGEFGPKIHLGADAGAATVNLNERCSRAVAIDAMGRAYAVTDWSLGGYVHSIAIERFAADGAPLDAAPILAYEGPKAVRRPVIAAAPSGDFIVAWETDGDGDDVLYRRYGADGLASGAAVVAATSTNGHQKDPTVVMNGAGAAVVAFRSILGVDFEGKHVIRARTIPVDGEPPADFVAGVVAEDVVAPALAMRSDGSFVLAFPDKNGALYARGFTPAGDLSVALEPVPELFASAANSFPWTGVAALEDGGFALAGETLDGHVSVNRYNSAGTLVVATNASTSALGSIPRIDLAADAAGNLAALWAGCGLPGEEDNCASDPVGLLLRRIYADGEPLGATAQIDMIAHFKPQVIGVASNAVGDLAVVAQDDAETFLRIAPAACP